jgi:outer membrane protein OmpA-like peptidoglycan-associated protein
VEQWRAPATDPRAHEADESGDDEAAPREAYDGLRDGAARGADQDEQETFTPLLDLLPASDYSAVVTIVQPDDVLNADDNDGQMITLGLDVAFGTPYRAPAGAESTAERTPYPERREEPAPAAPVAETAPLHCADADGDGISDTDDRCPTQAGPPENFGCPSLDPCGGTPLVVQAQFDFDSAGLPAHVSGIPQTMDPVLDAVATAIDNEPSCRVCIVGYASEEGPVEYNQELSERRAVAVRGYLTARGLSEARMPTTAFGARCQLVPIATRPLNRRVEFRRLDEGASCPTECSE